MEEVSLEWSQSNSEDLDGENYFTIKEITDLYEQSTGVIVNGGTNSRHEGQDNVPPAPSSSINYRKLDQPQLKSNNEYDDPDVAAFREITEKSRSRKRRADKNSWIRNVNQLKRMKGEAYQGYKRQICEKTGRKRLKFGAARAARKLGTTCVSGQCLKRKNLHCSEFSESIRQEIFTNFWRNMSWEQKKAYVILLVDSIAVKRRAAASLERRKETLCYFLKLFDQRVRVCRFMFLSTLGLGKSEVLDWIKGSHMGMASPKVKKSKPKLRSVVASAEEYINLLPVLPSHYSRANTSKIYLQPDIKSKAELFKNYLDHCKIKGYSPCSSFTFAKVLERKNIGIFVPRKDQCDVCTAHEHGNLENSEWELHRKRKELAREEKEKDKLNALQGKCHVVTMDLQAVLLSPSLKASSLYYKTKLMVHNFTVYDLTTHLAVCYVWNESEGNLKSSVFASCLADFIEMNFRDDLPIIVFSDGCTAQNRNTMMANALLEISVSQNREIFQKFLERGHTQMDCDSVHSVIGAAVKNRVIFVSHDYVAIIERSRRKQPYIVKEVSHSFFKNYALEENQRYTNIRPGRKAGDACVTDLKMIKYCPTGKIMFKLTFEDEEWTLLPHAPKTICEKIEYSNLFDSRLKISSRKYKDLQDLKSVMPVQYHQFYNELPHL